jgi:hypothetical protein
MRSYPHQTATSIALKDYALSIAISAHLPLTPVGGFRKRATQVSHSMSKKSAGQNNDKSS